MPEDILDYGALQTEIKDAIINEPIEALNLGGLPIDIYFKNIESIPNDDYILMRRDSFGASDSSVILGVNPYKTLKELINEKASTGITEEERAIGQLVPVRKGLDLEPLIIDKFNKFFKQKIVKPRDMYVFKDYPFLTINYDGVTVLPEHGYLPVEIKVVTMTGERQYNPHKAMFVEGEGFKKLPSDVSEKNWTIAQKAAHYGIPPYYYTQVQQQIMGLNAPFGHLSVLFDKTWRFYTFQVWRDKNTLNELVIKAFKAWEQVESLRARKGVKQ